MAEDESKESEGKSGSPSMLPLILVLLIIPLATMAITQFVVIPQLQAVMGAGAHAAEGSADAGSGAKEKDSGADAGDDDKKREAKLGGMGDSYAFEGLVANLSGTMGTRFIKVSFEVRGEGSDVDQALRLNKSVVLDAIITTLSSESIQSLEVPGGRNRLRLSLIEGINQSLNEDLIDQLYFTEFMIQ
jgi:flagellar FliL protein